MSRNAPMPPVEPRRARRSAAPAPPKPFRTLNASYVEFAPTNPDALRPTLATADAERALRDAWRLLRLARPADASDAFHAVARMDRAHYRAVVAWSEALILLGRTPEAEGAVNDALERYGRNAELGAARGHVFLHQDDFDSALTCCDTATDLAPDCAYAWLIAGETRLRVRHALRFAFTCFDTARKVPDVWPMLDLRIGLACLEWGHMDHALKALNAAIRADETNALAWVLLGDVLQRMDRRGAAAECWRNAGGLSPESPMTRDRLSPTARFLRRMGRLAGAVQDALTPDPPAED